MSMSEDYRKFRAQVADILEVSEEDLESHDLRAIESFDSMGKINIGLLIEEELGWRIPYERLDNAGKLFEIYQEAKASLSSSS